MAVAPRQWGCTPPINTNLPTQEENAANDSLIAELRRKNNYESPQETQKRCAGSIPPETLETSTLTVSPSSIEALKIIQAVTVEFVKAVSRKKGYSAAVVEQAGGKIFTYGSYRLGVYNPGELVGL